LAEDIPEVLNETSEILHLWKWQFTDKYPKFHEAAVTYKKRNNLTSWSAQHLKELLHAINMRYVTLIPRSDREIALFTKEDLKSRKADLKSRLKIVPKFDPDSGESTTDNEEGETSRIHTVLNTPELLSEGKESAFDDESGNFIHVDTGIRRSSRHTEARTTLASTQFTLPPVSHCLRARTPDEDRQADEPKDSPLTKESSCRQSLRDLFETLCDRRREEAEQLFQAIDRDADERSRLQALSLSQREEIVRLEETVTRISRQVEETVTRISRQVEQAAYTKDGQEDEYGRGYIDEAAANRRSFSRASPPGPGIQPESVKALQALVEALQLEVEDWKQKYEKSNSNIGTLIGTFIDRQKQLEGQLREKTSEVETVTAKLLQQNGELDGRVANSKSFTDDPVLCFVSQNPQFNTERKVSLHFLPARRSQAHLANLLTVRSENFETSTKIGGTCPKTCSLLTFFRLATTWVKNL